MEKEQKPAVEVVLTVLHAGGKFGDGGGYKVSGGLHGVGVSVVNALSEQLRVEVRRDGFTCDAGLRARQAAGRRWRRAQPTKETGTSITFLPDDEIMETLDFDFTTLEERLRETAFLTRGLKISLTDERGEGSSVEFQYEGGIEDFVSYLNENKEPVQRKIVFFSGESDGGRRRGRDAVERLLPGVGLLVREQHQHARGRLPPVAASAPRSRARSTSTRARRAC